MFFCWVIGVKSGCWRTLTDSSHMNRENGVVFVPWPDNVEGWKDLAHMLVSTAPREGGLSWSIWLLLFFLATKIFTLTPMDFRRPNFSQAPLLSAFCCLPRSSWFWSEKLEKLHSLSVTLPTKSKLQSRPASHSHQQLPSRHK